MSDTGKCKIALNEVGEFYGRRNIRLGKREDMGFAHIYGLMEKTIRIETLILSNPEIYHIEHVNQHGDESPCM